VASVPIKPSIAIVDDDEFARDSATGTLRALGFLVGSFSSAEEFLNSKRIHITSCLIANARMSAMSGLALYGKLVASGHPIPTILTTAVADNDIRARALNAGVSGYLVKPYSETDLLDCIEVALKHSVLYVPIRR
jgi:FixJ family two-component response regulator